MTFNAQKLIILPLFFCVTIFDVPRIDVFKITERKRSNETIGCYITCFIFQDVPTSANIKINDESYEFLGQDLKLNRPTSA